MNMIQFNPDRQEAKHAIAVSFDLSGFSTFCRGPNKTLAVEVIAPRGNEFISAHKLP